MDELNKKLAEWAGFKEADIKKYYYWEIGGERVAKWIEPNTDYHCKLPNFTQSLDVCFKWLVPKLFTWSIGKNWELQSDFTIKENGIKASVDLHYVDPDKYDQIKPSEAIAETPALALCLAIEKLIDSTSTIGASL